jgi:hypothetical protein
MAYTPKKYILPDPALAMALKTHKPMVEMQDFFVENYLLCHMRNNEDTKVIELGAGNAGWPLALHDLGYKNPEWYLVEDFSWARSAKTKSDWAKTADELEVQILEHDPNFKLKSITPTIPDNDTVYDVIRVDCMMDQEKLIEFIQKHTHYGSWVIIDDCKMDCGFERLALAFRLILSGLITPVWIGEKESIFSCNKNDGVDAIELLKSIPKYHTDLYHRQESYQIDTRTMVYAVTTTFEIPGDRKLCI